MNASTIFWVLIVALIIVIGEGIWEAIMDGRRKKKWEELQAKEAQAAQDQQRRENVAKEMRGEP